MTSIQSEFDILIVGAGLVGAALACQLAGYSTSRHLRIAIAEAGAPPALIDAEQFDPRVVALSLASQDYLQQLSVWEAIEESRKCPYGDMHVWDGEGTGAIHFDARDMQQDYLGHIVENGAAKAALWQRLKALPSIELLHPIKAIQLQDQHNGAFDVMFDNDEVVRATLVIAADGAFSQIRQLAHFKTREWGYGHKAIVTTVESELGHGFTAWQRFLSSGPLAFLPLRSDGERHCSIVWSLQESMADEMMELDAENFNQRLGRAFEYRLGNIVASDQRFCINLRQRHAVDYCKSNIALVGDAAHTIHPLAGQGVNLGLLDAAALGGEIIRALERGVPLDDASVLRRYQRQRQSHNMGMMALMEGFKRLFGSRRLSLRLLRNSGMSRLDSLGMLKNALAKQAMGL